MFPSVFTDELAMDFAQTLPIIKSWGLKHVDLRGRIFGRSLDKLSAEQLTEMKKLLAEHEMSIGCLQSSLCKVHWPNAEGRREEEQKLEGIIRTADALDCRLVRAFFYWQPPEEEEGALAVRPDVLQKTVDMFMPIAERAKQAGLILAFENCGVTPAEVLALLDVLNEPSWGLAWDCNSHWNSKERLADETEYIVRLARRAKCVHVKAHGSVASVSKELLPWDRLLATCAAAGVPGPVSAETHNPDKSVSDAEMTHQVVQAIQRAWPTAAPGDIRSAAKPVRKVLRSYADNPVGFVVVGLGMGHNRAREITQTPGAKLIGVCDLRLDRAKRSGEQFGVPYSTDLRDWLDKKEVEVIWDVVPTGAHAEVALQALEAGKHVLSTKPMEATLAACDAMIRKAEEKKLLLGVDFARRFDADALELKVAVAKGFFGRLLSGEASAKILRTMDYYNDNGGWRGTRRWDGGGVLSNQNVHTLDQLAFCFGVPARVKCAIWTQNHDIEAEDMGTAIWEYANGFVVTLYATTCYPQPTWYSRMEIHGTEGAYSSASGGFLEKRQTLWYHDNAWSAEPPEKIEAPWLNPGDNFAAAVRTGEPLLCTGRDGRRSQAILDAMYRSAYGDGGWVKVEPEMPRKG
jgi:predicted dehydrogenase/sugar phosphate isomerase/epimerase